MLNLDPYRTSVDEEEWSSDRDEKWSQVEDEATSLGITRGEWEHDENIKDYGDFEYDEDGNEI